ncbi:2OG-Fe dioxygenase family protein [Methylophaga sp.]|uniref:2OG-Fe dioxygenase family protein n=1 Tax=Methylophaga sp. TaxID=2024840 RepID=UPI003A8E9774
MDEPTLTSNEFILIKPKLNNKKIKSLFDDIPYDPYFDGGYRYRSKSRIEIEPDGNLKFLERLDLYQPEHINSYQNYGGVSRSYQDIPEWSLTDSDFNILIKTWLATIPESITKISVHQIRTTSDLGKTVPEGRHRDGYDYIGLYVVSRDNITKNSALTNVWCNESDEVIFEDYLSEGSLLSFNDNKVTHYTGDIIADNKQKQCSRDVIILTYPDEGIY